MKQDLIDKAEAALAGYRGALALGKASLLTLRTLATEAREAGADEAKIARLETGIALLTSMH